MRCGMERDNRDEDIMMRGTKQEMPGFRFRLLRPEKKRELWNPDFELLFLSYSNTINNCNFIKR